MPGALAAELRAGPLVVRGAGGLDEVDPRRIEIQAGAAGFAVAELAAVGEAREREIARGGRLGAVLVALVGADARPGVSARQEAGAPDVSGDTREAIAGFDLRGGGAMAILVQGRDEAGARIAGVASTDLGAVLEVRLHILVASALPAALTLPLTGVALVFLAGLRLRGGVVVEAFERVPDGMTRGCEREQERQREEEDRPVHADRLSNGWTIA